MVELVEEDMRDLERPPTFDLALNLFTSFGYFADTAEDLQVLRNLHASLTPGGSALPRDSSPAPGIGMSSATSSCSKSVPFTMDGAPSRNHWIWIRGSEQKEFAWTIRIYSGAELSGLLFDAGFSAVQLYASLAGIPYDQDAERLVVVGMR